jgi:diacylglycerol kinase family enzyme
LHSQVAEWSFARRPPLDVGRAAAPWGKRSFIESVGCGLVADLMARLEREKERHGSTSLAGGDEVRAAREELRRMLHRARPRECRLKADRQDLSGRYLLVEVMNIRQIGPRLRLAPSADSGDGLLDVVAVGDEHREALDASLRDRASATAAAFADVGVTRQARKVLLDPLGQRVHLDDGAWPENEQAARPGPIRLDLDAHALEFLSPGTENRAAR